MSLANVLPLAPVFLILAPVYFHLFMVGWVTQLIIGIAWWMFPTLSRERPRGDERLGWAVLLTLNTGLLLRTIAEPWMATTSSVAVGWLLVGSALLQVVSGALVTLMLWPRIKGR